MLRRYRRIVVDDKGAARRDSVDWFFVIICIGVTVSLVFLLVGCVEFIRFSVEVFRTWLSHH